MLSSYPSYTSDPSYTTDSSLKRGIEDEEDMVMCSPAKRGHFSPFDQEQAGFGYTQHSGWHMQLHVMQQPLFGLGFEAEQQQCFRLQAAELQQQEAEQAAEEYNVMQQQAHAQVQTEQSSGVQASITRFFRPAAVTSSGSSSSRRRAHNHSVQSQEQEQEQEEEQQMETVVCSACIVPSMTDTSFVTSCAFCERAVCGNCIHECSGCQQGFCKFCCTTTYDSTFERLACFACAQQSSL